MVYEVQQSTAGEEIFSLCPTKCFSWVWSAGELAVYSFLKRCENRKTHQCWPSIRTIGQAGADEVRTPSASTSGSWRSVDLSPQNLQR